MSKWFQNSNRIKLSLLLCCLISAILIHAQTPQFKKIEVAPKISELKILNVQQDTMGYLWLGTNQGILKFNGVEYRTVQLPDSLQNASVTALEISKEWLVAGFKNGYVAKIDYRNLQTIWHKKVSSVAITSFAEDESASIWIGTDGSGVVVLSDTTTTVLNSENGLIDNFVHSLAFCNHHVAVATDLGLSLCTKNQQKFSCHNFDVDNGLTDNLILSIIPHGQDNLLLGMQNGTVCNFNSSSYRIDAFSAINNLGLSPIRKLLMLDNLVLIVTENSGAFIVNWDDNFQVQQFQLHEENQINRIPLDCTVDSEGDLLIAFGDNNLVISDFRIQFIRNHEGQSFSDAQCLLADHEGNLWFANSKGIYKHPGEFASDQLLQAYYEAPPSLSKIITLCESADGNIWFGTFGSGLGKIDPNTQKVTLYTEKNGLVNNNVLSITKQDSLLWMATLGGACYFNTYDSKPEFHSFNAKSSLGSNFIYTVFNDSKNRIWFGTDGHGLVSYHNGVFDPMLNHFPEAGKSIISIAEDEHNNLWFSSTDKGLQWTDEKVLHSVRMNTAKEKVDIFAINSDPFGNIIALTSLGIAVLNHHNEHPSFVRTGFDIRVNYLNVISRDVKGRMWLGTEEAMVRYSDFNLGKNIRPQPYIESMEVMLQPADTNVHEYAYDQNHFTFKLASIWFQNPEAVIFQYKLDGFDMAWITTRNRSAIFSQLRPGKYRFLVRSSFNEDWENAVVKGYSFVIKAPYWQRSWFYLALILLLSIIIWMLLRLRFNRIKSREVLAREKVQSQFDTLRNQVNPHFLFNSFNTLISIISTNQDAAIGYVEKLSDYFRIVLEQRDKDVISVKEELELVRSYLFLQQQRFGENLKVTIDLEDAVLRSFIPPLTIQLLVENAIKHNVISRTKPLTINISGFHNTLVVSNNIQSKITKEPSTGIGLENIKHRYKILFNNEILINDNGEDFTVNLPINYQLE